MKHKALWSLFSVLMISALLLAACQPATADEAAGPLKFGMVLVGERRKPN